MLEKINTENQLGVAIWLAKHTKLSARRINELCPEIHEFKIILLRNGKVKLEESEINPLEYNFYTLGDLVEHKAEEESKEIYNKMTQNQKRYIPHHLRQYIPGAVKWIVEHYPEKTHKDIGGLFGKTSKYVQEILQTKLEIPMINPVSVKLITKDILHEWLNKK